jgi:hypothetical protein
MTLTGPLRKMLSDPARPVAYRLPIGDESLPLNPTIGAPLHLRFEGEILCRHCGRRTRKSYSQGYCFPCSQRLAACDLCIVRPERCHYAHGTCREPAWGEAHCMRPHFVYLANTSGLKVGITRAHQGETRWVDQGASQALPILAVASRHIAGLIEVALAEHVSDRTDWRVMLRGPAPPLDLVGERDQLLGQCAATIESIRARFGKDAVRVLKREQVREFQYPVVAYPDRIRSLSLDRTPVVEGRLDGVKGQYLIFEQGVLNVRKFGAYVVAVDT